jgi:hypothetical protein
VARIRLWSTSTPSIRQLVFRFVHGDTSHREQKSWINAVITGFDARPVEHARGCPFSRSVGSRAYPHDIEHPGNDVVWREVFSATSCDVKGKRIDGVSLGVFARSATRDTRMLPVRAVWRIDRERHQFVPLPTPTSCATDGIYTPHAPG